MTGDVVPDSGSRGNRQAAVRSGPTGSGLLGDGSRLEVAVGRGLDPWAVVWTCGLSVGGG